MYLGFYFLTVNKFKKKMNDTGAPERHVGTISASSSLGTIVGDEGDGVNLPAHLHACA
jgi:hypothetical protein